MLNSGTLPSLLHPWGSGATVAITGISGFLGTVLGRHLEQHGHATIGISAGNRNLPDEVRCKILYQELVKAIRNFRLDVVFHLAGSGSPYANSLKPLYHEWANVQTTKAVVEAIETTHFAGRVVFSSSASVYGNSGFEIVHEEAMVRPCCDYGRTKVQGEAYLIERLGCRCDLIVARIFNVFGPGQRKLVVYDLATRLLTSGQPLVVRSSGEEFRDFIFVEDAIRALVFLGVELAARENPQIINVCSGIPTKVGDLARLLSRLCGHSGDDLLFSHEGINPVAACVGDPGRLERLGMTIPPASEQQFAETLLWIRDSCLP